MFVPSKARTLGAHGYSARVLYNAKVTSNPENGKAVTGSALGCSDSVSSGAVAAPTASAPAVPTKERLRKRVPRGGANAMLVVDRVVYIC